MPPGIGRQPGGPVITGSPVPPSNSMNLQSTRSYNPGSASGTDNIAPPGPFIISTPEASAPPPNTLPPSYDEALSAPYPSFVTAGTQRHSSDSGLPSYDTFTNKSSTKL